MTFLREKAHIALLFPRSVFNWIAVLCFPVSGLQPILMHSCAVFLFQDCYRVYQAIDRMPYLVEALEGHTGQHGSLIMEVFSNPIKVSSVLSTKVSLVLFYQGQSSSVLCIKVGQILCTLLKSV